MSGWSSCPQKLPVLEFLLMPPEEVEARFPELSMRCMPSLPCASRLLVLSGWRLYRLLLLSMRYMPWKSLVLPTRPICGICARLPVLLLRERLSARPSDILPSEELMLRRDISVMFGIDVRIAHVRVCACMREKAGTSSPSAR
jgi:hypothetical protein